MNNGPMVYPMLQANIQVYPMLSHGKFGIMMHPHKFVEGLEWCN
jgi:hypothetical protein